MVIIMAETMGQIIKKLRKERNLTQEELAEQLNLSAAAVSKWENNAAMPDISQVVPLAHLFGVPTDVLFGVYGSGYDEGVEARLEEIFRIYDNCQDGEEGPTALLILDKYREAMRLYPNNSTIMVNAIAFAEMVLSSNERDLLALVGQDGLDSITQEMIRWADLVIKYSTSIDYVLSAKSALMNIYVRRKNWDEALKLADAFPNNISDIRNMQKANLYSSSGDTVKERELRCYNIRELADALGHQVTMLGNIYMNEGKYEDALHCYSFFGDMVDSIYRDEEYRPPFVFYQLALFRCPAICLVKLGREDEAIAMLEKGVRFILAQAEYFNKKKRVDTPLLVDCSFGYGYDGDCEYPDVKQKLKNLIYCDDFAPIAQDTRYRALVAKIDNVI